MSTLRVLVVAAFVAVGGGVRGQEAASRPAQLSLVEAKRMALAGNPGVEALLARVRAADAVVRQARSAFAPQVSASAAASYLQDVPLADGNTDGVRFYQTGIAANWLLFDGFASRFRVAAAAAGSDVSLAEWHDGQRLLAQGVASAFLSCLLAAEAARVDERDAEFNRELLAEAEKRLTAGAGARVDVLNFRVRVRAAENQLLGIRRDLRAGRQALAALLGLPTAELPPATELLSPDAAALRPLPPAEQAIADAYAQRPDLQRCQHALAQLDATIAARRSDFMPRLAAQGSYAVERVGNPRFSDDRDASSFVGLGFTWDLYDGGRRSGAVAEAQAERLALARRRDQLRTDIAAEVRQALDAATTATAQSENQRQISDLAREIRDIVRKEYLSGVSPLTRLNETQTDLVRAEGLLAQMRIRRDQALETLAAALGDNLPEL